MAETHTNGTTSLVVRKPKVTAQAEKQEIYEFEKEVVAVTLVGTTQLIVNNFSEKSIQQIEDERRLTAEEKRALKKAAKSPVIPEERWQAARILDDDGRDCFPARWVKAALVTAATRFGEDTGTKGTQIRGAVFVLGDLLPITFRGVKAKGAGPHGLPVMRRDVVRVGNFPNKKPDFRYRPGYDDWSLDIRVEFEPKLISLAGLYHLIRRAGSSVGLGEWRPEKSPAGIYGRFDIAGVRS